jgi:hypothetical protein
MRWIERFYQRKKFTVEPTGEQSNEQNFRGCYPTRIFVEDTADAPTSIGISLDDPTDEAAAFIGLESGGSDLAITVVPGKWVAIASDISKLIGCSRVKIDCAAWSAGGRIWVDTST